MLVKAISLSGANFRNDCKILNTNENNINLRVEYKHHIVDVGSKPGSAFSYKSFLVYTDKHY